VKWVTLERAPRWNDSEIVERGLLRKKKSYVRIHCRGKYSWKILHGASKKLQQAATERVGL